MILKITDIFLEIEEIRNNFNELEKSLNLKKPRDDIDSVCYKDLDKDEDLDEDHMLMMINIEKLGALEDYLKGLIVIITSQ